MSSPHVLELEGGGWEVAVISSDWSWSVVRWSSLNLAGVVRIVSKESIAELAESESSVTVLVVSGDEELYFFSCWIHTNCIEAFTNVMNGNLPDPRNVENVETIKQVEVTFLG